MTAPFAGVIPNGMFIPEPLSDRRHTPLVVEHDEPVAFRGTYRVVTLMKP